MSDTLCIQDSKVVLTTDEGRKFERSENQLLEMLRTELLPPIDGTALPDGVKFIEFRDPVMLVIHQLPPHVRQMRWIATDSPRKFGPGTKYRKAPEHSLRDHLCRLHPAWRAPVPRAIE